MLLLPLDDATQQFFRLQLIADEVVVNQETPFEALGQNRVEFGEHLLSTFDSRPASEDCDDVAKLAKEGTAARELYGRCAIVAALQQIKSRYRHGRHVSLFLLFVAGFGGCA